MDGVRIPIDGWLSWQGCWVSVSSSDTDSLPERLREYLLRLCSLFRGGLRFSWRGVCVQLCMGRVTRTQIRFIIRNNYLTLACLKSATVWCSVRNKIVMATCHWKTKTHVQNLLILLFCRVSNPERIYTRSTSSISVGFNIKAKNWGTHSPV